MGFEGPNFELMSRLRVTTADPHRRLERDLDMLRAPLSQARFTEILTRFFGFYTVWEPAMSMVPTLGEILQGRSKLAPLVHDLMTLNDGRFIPGAVERCDSAADLCASRERAIGSLYVMEGSMLGGQVISRALAEASWVPAEGLRYFQAYGEETGTMWNGFKAWANQAVAPADWAEVEFGARNTFYLLHRWLTPGLPA